MTSLIVKDFFFLKLCPIFVGSLFIGKNVKKLRSMSNLKFRSRTNCTLSWVMGDDIGSDSATDCRLWSDSNHRRHTQQYQNKRNPNRYHHPLITQLTLRYTYSTLDSTIYSNITGDLFSNKMIKVSLFMKKK